MHTSSHLCRAAMVASVAGLAAVPALADEIALTAPMQGATLHEGGIDMSVCFLDLDATYKVVATYVDIASGHDPARLRMGLADGDAVHFSRPGLRHVYYGIAREGGVVRVSAEPAVAEVTQLTE